MIYWDAVIFVKQANLRAMTGQLRTEDIQQQSRAAPSRDPATASFRNDQTLKRNSTRLPHRKT